MNMRGLRWSGIGMGNDVIKNRSLTYWFIRFKIGCFGGNVYLCGNYNMNYGKAKRNQSF